MILGSAIATQVVPQSERCCVVQADLPFKSKPKQMTKRKRPTLEQKRAVVLEPHERKAVSLVAQLNALRNDKAQKRRAQQSRRREVSL